MSLRAALLCCDPELSGFLVLRFFGQASILLPCSFIRANLPHECLGRLSQGRDPVLFALAT